MAGIEHIPVEADEAGMRLDRWFKIHYPGLGFGALQKLLRSGQVRVDGGRVKTDARVQPGQVVRIPPLDVDAKKTGPIASHDLKHGDDHELLSRMLLHEDEKVFVLNKPAGLAVQGGSGLNRHIDKMLEAWTSKKGEKPRLVHRLDRDTSGIIIAARTKPAAAFFSGAFAGRDVKKTYLAIVCGGAPSPETGEVALALKKSSRRGLDIMAVAGDGQTALTRYRTLAATPEAALVELQPETGRMHQLRAHMAALGHPIAGDGKYGGLYRIGGADIPRLMLHAAKLDVPHPDGARRTFVAPPPPEFSHLARSLGLEAPTS